MSFENNFKHKLKQDIVKKFSKILDQRTTLATTS